MGPGCTDADRSAGKPAEIGQTAFEIRASRRCLARTAGRLLIAWIADPDGNAIQIVQPADRLLTG
jgi:hypothetical protein